MRLTALDYVIAFAGAAVMFVLLAVVQVGAVSFTAATVALFVVIWLRRRSPTWPII